MPTTAEEDRKFREAVIPHDLLEDSIDWIGSNMIPQAVFSEEDLAEWAEENGFVRESD